MLKTIIRYIEDLPDLITLAKLLKRVERHIITTGYRPHCRKRKHSYPIFPQVSILGENIRRFITREIVIGRKSFELVRSFLRDIARIAVSDGEISLILKTQAEKLTPESERIHTNSRASPGRHYDETIWKVQNGMLGNYDWIERPTDSQDAYIALGRRRTKEVALELRGGHQDKPA
jgi:hypothetical protein